MTMRKQMSWVISSLQFSQGNQANLDLPETITVAHELDLDVSEDSVHKALSNLNVSKCPGPDKFHPRVLYKLRDIIIKPLAIIFQTSLRSGVLPDDWKRANITAIHKKGSKKVAGNYRPISLTTVICKVFETLVRNSLVDYMKDNNLFSSKQFGFVSGRSTVLQLITVT